MKFEIVKNYKKESSFEAEIIVGKKEKYSEFGFKCENEETLFLPERKKFIIAIDSLNEENIKIASAKIAKTLKEKTECFKIRAPKTKNMDILENFVEGFILGDYEFDKYKTKKAKHLKKVIISGDEKVLKEAVRVAEIRAESINLTRDIVNSMPDEVYPEVMADYAKKIAKENGYECNIMMKNILKKRDMELFMQWQKHQLMHQGLSI
jgi:leucyl aminopeptidase